jgi:hypothetical protein
MRYSPGSRKLNKTAPELVQVHKNCRCASSR